jgi:tRNA threonylcarbamoyladenosine biosynthesis protein TsaE
LAESVITCTAEGEEAMVALGVALSEALVPGVVVHLEGELGMGKTTLSRGIIQGLGHEGAVKSPTYTLVEPYEHTRIPVYHFDLYRLGDPEELELMGIRDYLDGHSVCLVEWPERGEGVLPPADLVITIGKEGAGRSLRLRASSASGEAVLDRLQGKA